MHLPAINSDPFSVLGINHTATIDELRHAYRKKALEFHPDHNKKSKALAHEEFLALHDAFESLIELMPTDTDHATPNSPALAAWGTVWVDDEENPTFQHIKNLGDHLHFDIDALWDCHKQLIATLEQYGKADYEKYTDFISQIIGDTAAECKNLESKFINIDSKCLGEGGPSNEKRKAKELFSSLSTLVISISTMHKDSIEARAMLEEKETLTDGEWENIWKKLNSMTNYFFGR